MLKQLPVKKEYLFIASVIILLLISYQLAFKKTLEAWQINKQLKTQIAQASDLSIQPAYLERKNNNLSKIISTYKTDTITFRSNIINTISIIAEKEHVKLSEVPLADPLFHNDKFIIQKLSFEGDFFALTKVLNQLQAAKGVGVVRSISYKSIALNSKNDDVKKIVMGIYFEILK
ncbi:hypothetical protein [Mucilaginibacter sp. OK098]|uniref:hypothetical protein n=1 Tax=Mucilaginibacter sp. OK098 TaxID=1855297 RepID=UPI00091D7592|nr:hypothetical protein [Mucilaginibacter sp. OK098]SHL98138.1 hypothetical protein SAMN05216524_101405 [Mucilaginibacter sp. OK098]